MRWIQFHQCQIIDVAWDVIAGRGGQAFCTVVAYHLFSKVVKHLMRQGEVGYDVFAAVAFRSGSASSSGSLL